MPTPSPPGLTRSSPTIDYDGNPDAIPVVTDSAVAWLRNTKADGFRHDAVKHVPIKFWETLTKKLETEIGQKENRFVYQVGETISGHGTVAKFVGPDLLTGQFDFPTYFALQGVLGRGEGSMTDLAESIRAAQRYYSPASIMSPLIGNHDVARFMAYADGDIKSGLSDSEIKELAYSNQPKVDNPSSYQKIRLAFAFVTAIPGPPTLYYGDEIGMTGAGDPDNRRPMQWDGWTEDQKATKDIVESSTTRGSRRSPCGAARSRSSTNHPNASSLPASRPSKPSSSPSIASPPINPSR
jgi:cyclomaltodextrinase